MSDWKVNVVNTIVVVEALADATLLGEYMYDPANDVIGFTTLPGSFKINESGVHSIDFTPTQVGNYLIKITDTTNNKVNYANIQADEELDVQAIKAKTDQLVFTKANELDVNIQSQNDAELFGSGTDTDRWRGTP